MTTATITTRWHYIQLMDRRGLDIFRGAWLLVCLFVCLFGRGNDVRAREDRS